MRRLHRTLLRTAFGLVAAAAAGGFLLPQPAAAQRPLTISVLYGPNKPQALIWNRLEELVEEKLPGQFKFNIVTDGALGGEKETAEGVQLGSIHAALSTVANMQTWVPQGAIFDMPFMFRDIEHIESALSGPIGDEFKRLYAEQGFKVFGFIVYGARHVISQEPIRTPADVQGKKMRVLQSPLHIELWKSLGANPTPVPITEAYNALETGVVDYMDMTMSGYQALKLYEVVPSFTRTAHIWSLGVMYMGMPFWESLDDEQKAAFEEAAAEAIPYFNRIAAEEQETSLKVAVEKGATVIEPDVAPWRAAMAEFWESYADNVGGIDKVQAIADVE